MRYLSAFLLMALLVAGCADSDEWAAVQAGTEAPAGGDGQDVLALRVGEAGWSETPTTVTRAYETLEDLRMDSSQKWDFTSSMSSVDLTNLTSDAENWLYDSGNYSNKKAFSGEVTVNGVKLGLTEGLSFGNIGVSNFHIRPGDYIQMGGTSQVLTIPNLKQGQTVTIEFVSDNPSTLTPSNLTGDTGFGTDVSTTKHKGTGTVTADGSVTFTTTGAVNIYSIEISRRLDDGFGIYCSRMGLSNQQVVWDGDASRWYYGDEIYWPRSQGRKYVSFNNRTTTQSEGSYFTISSGASINTKFNGCVYRGVTYTSGLKMETGVATTISFTSEEVCNVIIVQSNWSVHTLKFDDVEIPLSTASGKITISEKTYDYTLTTIPGGRVYTIYEVAAGSHSHTIKRGSGESGVLYVSVERCFTVHAYAPYKGTSPYTFDEANHALTFATDANGKAPVDLLYACDATVSQSSGETILDFKHALARVAFGTIGNTKGTHDMLVTNIGVKGTYYTRGKLNLSSGEWSEKVLGSETTVNVVDEAKDEFVFVASGDQKMVRTTQVQADYSVKVKDVEKPMFIPDPTAEVTVTFKYYEQPDLVSLDDDMFHVWNGYGAGAAVVDALSPASLPYEYNNNLGVGLGGGGTIIGSSTVHNLAYADLTAYDKMVIIGTPGLGMRVLMNRLSSLSLALVAGVNPSPSSATISPAAQVFSIPISGLKANSTPTVVITPAISYEVSQTTDELAAGTATIKVTLPENASTTDPATYTVTINGATSADAAFSHAVTITQKPKGAINHYTLSNDGNGGAYVETLVNIGVDGYVVLDLTKLHGQDGFVHLNSLKVHWSSISGTVSRLLLLKKNPEAKTASHSTTLEQGKSAVFNLAVGRNFEVEIDGGASRLMNNE